jgi:hypothetical protein
MISFTKKEREYIPQLLVVFHTIGTTVIESVISTKAYCPFFYSFTQNPMAVSNVIRYS